MQESIRDVIKKHIVEMIESSSKEVSADYIANILASQPGNHGKSAEELKQRWITSATFKLTTVYAHLSDLGVTSGKTGESKTVGPIIVDSNTHQVARTLGQFGAAPDFLVLDGQNRVVAARDKSPTATIPAYVGNKIFAQLDRKNKEYSKEHNELQSAIADFLATPTMPGSKLTRLKVYVQRGLLSSSELESIRAQWKSKYRG